MIVEDANRLTGARARAPGWAEVPGEGQRRAGMAVRRFWQNYPRGLSVGADENGRVRLSFAMLPPGGYWPLTEESEKARTYQFEGGRQKTAELLLWFDDPGSSPEDLSKAFEQPLFARAPTAWYRDTGAVLPLAAEGVRADDPELAEAIERYDRLQRAKVIVDAGDPAGPNLPFTRDWYGKVSIPNLRARASDVLCGWMNYGDLIWGHGYCSLYYEWPYAMLQQHLRLGNREFLDVAEDMIRHRYDIDQYHVEDSAPHLGGFQRYEKGQHGNLNEEEDRRWEKNCHATHTWNRCLLLHWALTGDPRSLETALQNGRAFHRLFYGQYKLAEKEKLPIAEFRTQAWATENWLALYEYVGDKKYLDWAAETFDKTLLAMEKENGSCGHIVKDGKQSSQFLSFVVEPVCRLHHYTGREDVIRFLQRVLDWQRAKGTIRGFEKDGIYYPTQWLEEWKDKPLPLDKPTVFAAQIHRSMPFADGFAYLSHVLGRPEDRVFARKIFREYMFYYGLMDGAPRAQRTPLGYHWRGDAFASNPKVQVWNSRYGQLFLSLEEGLAP